MSNRQDKEREAELQPQRLEFAKAQLIKKGVTILLETDTRIDFTWKDSTVSFYPYSGWATGKTIQDGRGINNLLKQLK